MDIDNVMCVYVAIMTIEDQYLMLYCGLVMKFILVGFLSVAYQDNETNC